MSVQLSCVALFTPIYFILSHVLCERPKPLRAGGCGVCGGWHGLSGRDVIKHQGWHQVVDGQCLVELEAQSAGGLRNVGHRVAVQLQTGHDARPVRSVTCRG